VLRNLSINKEASLDAMREAGAFDVLQVAILRHNLSRSYLNLAKVIKDQLQQMNGI